MYPQTWMIIKSLPHVILKNMNFNFVKLKMIFINLFISLQVILWLCFFGSLNAVPKPEISKLSSSKVAKRQLDTYGSPAADPQVDTYGAPQSAPCDLEVRIGR